MKITWNLQHMQVCCVWFVDLFRTHKEIALHLDKIVDVHGIIPSNHNVSWGLYFHHCRRSGLGDFLLYLWDSWNATREKEHLERLWDRNLGQQFLFWMCGRHWAISAGIWGTRQSENTNIAGPVALAQVNRFGSRSSNKLCVIHRFVSDCRKKHNAGRWQKTCL